jgi:hypothetical protein
MSILRIKPSQRCVNCRLPRQYVRDNRMMCVVRDDGQQLSHYYVPLTKDSIYN